MEHGKETVWQNMLLHRFFGKCRPGICRCPGNGDKIRRLPRNRSCYGGSGPLPPVHDTYMPVEYDPGFVEEITRAALESISEKYAKQLPESVSCNATVACGYPATEILRLTEEKAIDLLVMGSHGLTGLAHVLFGSTAERIVRRAGCSVLTVRLKKS